VHNREIEMKRTVRDRDRERERERAQWLWDLDRVLGFSVSWKSQVLRFVWQYCPAFSNELGNFNGVIWWLTDGNNAV
jgi:hypothetical protein